MYYAVWLCVILRLCILCVSVECVALLFKSLNLAAMFVRMANTSTPLYTPPPVIAFRERYAYVLRIYSTHARLR